LRLAIWGAAAVMLLLPAVAMQFTSQVNWGPGDFITFGAMLLFACGGYELATRLTGNRAYRLATGMALLGAFLLAWINLAVGIIGNEAHPANRMFFAIPVIGMAGALIARFEARGMARALVATAVTQVLAALIALTAGWEDATVVVGLTVFFALLWLSSAQLFRKAAQKNTAA
jgi:hypothetical protein